MRIARSYRQSCLSGGFDAIVIGSGMGGLATASLLARYRGKRVLVLEKHYTPGGFTHSFRRPGYEWDVGVHYVGEVMHPDSALRRVFDVISGGELDWADVGPVYDRIRIGADSYDFVRGERGFTEQIQSYFPGEGPAIDAYLRRLRWVAGLSRVYFAERAIPAPLASLLGGVMRWPALHYARQTTAQSLASLTSNPRLRGVLAAQWGDYGLPPGQSSFFMHALVAQHYRGGAAYPVGGASRIAASVIPQIESRGGLVLTNGEVASILVESGRAAGVQMRDGQELRAPLVISDAGAYNTFRRLAPPEWRASLGEVLEGLEPSKGHLSLYVGLAHTAEELGLPKANLWIYPDHHHDRQFDRFLNDMEAPFPVVFISFPSAKDPDFARRHPGRSTIEVVTLAPYGPFARWADLRWRKRGFDYEELKQRLTERLLGHLFEHVPAVRGKIDFTELSTPLSTADFTGHPEGAIYGLAATPALFSRRGLGPRTALPGLYLTGADACTPGVAGALMAGVLTSLAVLGSGRL